MKERPILFNTKMVQRILSGEKTVTRRPVKFDKLSNIKKGRLFYSKLCDDWVIEDKGLNPEASVTMVECPFGKVGDKLFVQEDFWIDHVFYVNNEPLPLEMDDDCQRIIYNADGDCCHQICECQCAEVGEPLIREAKTMPEWASRITLEITNIRVERIQDITDEDLKREGFDFTPTVAINKFSHVWNSIYKEKGFGWNENGFVWVGEFKVVKK